MARDLTCPSCLSNRITESDATPYPMCRSCGFVVSENNEVIAPLRKNEQDPLTEWHEHYTVNNSTEKQIAQALEVLEDFCDVIGIDPETKIEASKLYAETSLKKVTDGRSTSIVVGGLLCIAAKRVGEPIPYQYLADKLDIDQQLLGTTIRILNRQVLNEIVVSEPQDYVSHVCSELGQGDLVALSATKILDNNRDRISFEGKNPCAIAAAAVYLSATEAVTQRSLARVSGVTTETIRVRLAEMREAIE